MSTSVFITNEYLQVVTGTRTRNKIKVKNHIRAQLPEGLILNGVITNEDGLKNVIKGVWLKCRFPTNDVRLLIDGSYLKTKVMNVPKTSEANLINIIRNEYSDIENYSEMLYDYTILNPRNELAGETILACATERSVIASYLDLFESQKISVNSIDLSICACIRCTRYMDFLMEQTYAIVNFDGNGVIVALFVNGQFKFSNRSRIIAERGSRNSIREITNILNGIIQFGKSEKTGEIACFYFCGIKESEQAICHAVGDALGIEVLELPNSRNIHTPDRKSGNVEKFRLSNYLCATGNL